MKICLTNKIGNFVPQLQLHVFYLQAKIWTWSKGDKLFSKTIYDKLFTNKIGSFVPTSTPNILPWSENLDFEQGTNSCQRQFIKNCFTSKIGNFDLCSNSIRYILKQKWIGTRGKTLLIKTIYDKIVWHKKLGILSPAPTPYILS